MADEIVPSSVTDLITSEVTSAEVLMLVADRDGSILTHPAIMYATATLSTSTVVRVPHLGLDGYDLLAAHTPGDEVGNTALSDGKTDVTIAERAKAYSLEDLAKYLTQGKLGPAAFARDLVISVAQTLVSLIANVTDDFTTVVGTTGTKLTWAKVLAAKGALGVADADGQAVMLVSKVQWAHLEEDALSLGVVPAAAGAAGVVNAGLSSYKGRYFGVDCFASSRVPPANAGADHAGAMWVRGGIAWADAPLSDEGDPNMVSYGRARLERVRKGDFLSTKWVFAMVAGVAKAIDGCGVTLISKATL